MSGFGQNMTMSKAPNVKWTRAHLLCHFVRFVFRLVAGGGWGEDGGGEAMGRGRRRRQPDPFEIIGPIAALIFAFVFFGSLLFGSFFIEALTALAVFVLVGGVVAVVLFLVIRSRGGQSGLVPPRSSSEEPLAHLSLEDVPRPEEGLTRLPSVHERLRAIDWFQFEKLVEVLYRRRGYEVERRGGANPDGGIDLIVEKDGERTAVQCKHWRREDVKLGQMREFLGTLTDSGIAKGTFVTLEGFTTDAKQLAIKHGIEIVNEGNLVTLISELDASGKAEISVLFNDKRKFCPKCESEMVLRTPGTGEKWDPFWGCPWYPKCNGKVNVH